MLFAILLFVLPFAAAQDDLSRFVDVFAGTSSGLFPGAIPAPFSPVKFGPQSPRAGPSGYSSSSRITSFSLMHNAPHLPSYGAVSQLPHVGPIADPLADLSLERAKPDEASVGYFKSVLTNGVTVEMGGTMRTGFVQYGFEGEPLGSVVVDGAARGEGVDWLGGGIEVRDGGYVGNGTYLTEGKEWTVFYCGRFSMVPEYINTWIGREGVLQQYGNETEVVGTERDGIGAVFNFRGGSIAAGISYSFVSTEQACGYINDEVPAGSTLGAVVANSKQRWNNEVFSKVTTTQQNSSHIATLYTALYHMHTFPTNRTGDNPIREYNVNEPYYDDFSLWDMHQTTTPLLHLLQPTMYEELLRSFIESSRLDRFLPSSRYANNPLHSPGGSFADNILADAYIKGVRNNIDWKAAYDASTRDAETSPPNNRDPLSPDSSTTFGRGAIPDWKNLGYITTRFDRSVSRAMEYSTNDFAVSQLAAAMEPDKTDKYLARSRNWRNHWHPHITSLNSTGFLVPRLTNQHFAPIDPLTCGSCSWRDDFFALPSWTYSVGATHDMAALITLAGGPEAFGSRLDTLLDPSIHLADPLSLNTLQVPYLYNFLNQQSRSVVASRRLAQRLVPSASFPGSSPALHSWLLWSIIGLYPLTGQTTYLLGSPWFSDLTLQLGNSKTLVVRAADVSDQNIHVQRVRINGQEWSRNWVEFDELFARGGSVEFDMGAEARAWDTGDLPPSPASGSDETGAVRGGFIGDEEFELWAKQRRIGIGLGVTALVLIVFGLAWWYLARKTKTPKVEGWMDREEQAQGAAHGRVGERMEQVRVWWRQKNEEGQQGGVAQQQREVEEPEVVAAVEFPFVPRRGERRSVRWERWERGFDRWLMDLEPGVGEGGGQRDLERGVVEGATGEKKSWRTSLARMIDGPAEEKAATGETIAGPTTARGHATVQNESPIPSSSALPRSSIDTSGKKSDKANKLSSVDPSRPGPVERTSSELALETPLPPSSDSSLLELPFTEAEHEAAKVAAAIVAESKRQSVRTGGQVARRSVFVELVDEEHDIDNPGADKLQEMRMTGVII